MPEPSPTAMPEPSPTGILVPGCGREPARRSFSLEDWRRCRKRSRSGGAVRRRRLEEVEQVADLTAELRWVTHQTVPVDDVLIAAAEATALEEAGLDQVGDDALDGSLGDPDVDRDISQPHFGITGDAEQDLRVVGDERPAAWGRFMS